MKRIRCILLSFFICLSPGFAQTLIYKQISGGQITLHTYVTRSNRSGYLLRLNRDSESQHLYEEFVLDSVYSTLEWKYKNLQTATDLSASRQDDVILLTGIHKNENIQKKFSLDSLPWIQLFPIGLETLAASSAGKMKFYAISTTPPAELNIAKFSAEIVGREAISCNGDSVDAVHIRISLASWKSLFWRGDCWFRTSDARYIKWDAAGPPGQPRSVVELISE